MTDWLNKTHVGDCRVLMRQMTADSVKVQTVVTSPPYWGLRDYGVAGQIGSEPTLRDWVDTMVGVFDCVWDVLADDGVLWLNLGDAYASDSKAGGETSGKQFYLGEANRRSVGRAKRETGLKSKDLMGQPWRVAFALQDAGWWLRSAVVWAKPNPMPESMTDRPTKSYEHVFLMTRSEHYHYDAAAIAEPASKNSHARAARARNVGTHVPPGSRPHKGSVGVHPKAVKRVSGWAEGDSSHSVKDHARSKAGLKDSTKFGRGAGWRNKQNESFCAAITELVNERNVRDVWTIPTQGFPGAHFATFPEELARRCVLAGSRPGDVVFDPFMGSGTVAQAATDLGRHYIGIELNPDSVKLQDDHRRTTTGMPF